VRRPTRATEAIIYRTRRFQSFEPREIYGAVLTKRSEPEEKTAKTVETEPNSPLLIRLVRDPYALETAQMSRVKFRDVEQSTDRRPDPFPRVMSEWDKVRFNGFAGNPARDLGIGPQPRLSPTAHEFADSDHPRWRCR